MTDPRVLAVCVVHAELEVPGRVGRTAIDKRPVPGRVRVGTLGLAGDHVCDTAHHGGTHQAVYAYAEEDARRWAANSAASCPRAGSGRICASPGSRSVTPCSARTGASATPCSR